jgi:hypothetical protein|tara:strand:+ start:420 stop:665 length:246 start_codon:yes stop_codon:yes gene_type:complete
MNTKVQVPFTRRLQGAYKAFTVQVPVPITMVSNQDLIDELNRREAKVKWARIVMSPNSKPKDRVKLGLSPSTIIEEMDCRK